MKARANATQLDPVSALAALGSDVRYRILKRMASGAIGTCCDRIELWENGASVTDVVKETGLAQSTISHHLGILHRAGLVHSEQRGPWTCYFVNRPTVEALLETLRQDLLSKQDCCGAGSDD